MSADTALRGNRVQWIKEMSKHSLSSHDDSPSSEQKSHSELKVHSELKALAKEVRSGIQPKDAQTDDFLVEYHQFRTQYTETHRQVLSRLDAMETHLRELESKMESRLAYMETRIAAHNLSIIDSRPVLSYPEYHTNSHTHEKEPETSVTETESSSSSFVGAERPANQTLDNNVVENTSSILCNDEICIIVSKFTPCVAEEDPIVTDNAELRGELLILHVTNTKYTNPLIIYPFGKDSPVNQEFDSLMLQLTFTTQNNLDGTIYGQFRKFNDVYVIECQPNANIDGNDVSVTELSFPVVFHGQVQLSLQ